MSRWTEIAYKAQSPGKTALLTAIPEGPKKQCHF
jgi:hypothetical protein